MHIQWHFLSMKLYFFIKPGRKVGLDVSYDIPKGGDCGPSICDTIVQKPNPQEARFCHRDIHIGIGIGIHFCI